MKKTGIIIALLAIAAVLMQTCINLPQRSHSSAFAIIVDSTTYAHTAEAVKAYRDAVERDGLAAEIVVDQWPNPESVKEAILALRDENLPLEGVVFIGAIPVPMIRDAHHLTSAFKMDPGRRTWRVSSVPSDRFYDDLDLRFNFLMQDTLNSLLFYYSLAPDSPQRVERDIYSARIWPSTTDTTKYAVISTYLQRVAQQKTVLNELDDAMIISGHGYNSESLNSWEDQYLVTREQFPRLFRPGGQLKNLYHEMTPDLKDLVLYYLQRPELDLAIFHAHGSETEQYITGIPDGKSIQGQVDAARLFLRSKLRQAQRRGKPLEETKQYYHEKFGVPLSWFEGTFDDSLIRQDSLADANLNIHIEDIQTISPQPDLVVFDECFNGAFINPPYVAGEYLFGSGAVATGIANTVNVKQDIWASEFLGLLQYGVRFGLVHRNWNYLETHLFGDPTYHFKCDGHDKLNRQLALDDNKLSPWKRMLGSEDPALRALAISLVFRNQGNKFESELIQVYRSDPDFTPRIQALKCLAQLRTAQFEDLLKESINDPHEFIRRISAAWMGEVGKTEYLPYLVEKILTDHSERVAFQSRSALEYIDPILAGQLMAERIETVPASLMATIESRARLNSFERSAQWVNDELVPKAQDKELALKKRHGAIRTFRNYRFHGAIPDLLEIAQDESDAVGIRVATIEALGWFAFSRQRSTIIAACQEIYSNDSDETIKNEALKTMERLRAGPNNPITP
ncbi:MAG: HEAT repeat domain-containing protein [Candidatus Marinimicrobia bacterium]|nr:HEAT repeat domain-containing protein [Candidatus Neomarinimicrobiota bacterium]